MRRQAWTCSISVVWILGVGACVSNTQQSGGSVRLAPSSRTVEADVPMPAGFEFVADASFSWSSGAVRFLRHRYEGQATRAAVRQFYLQQMPLARWIPVSDSFAEGRYTMRFTTAKLECMITVEDAGAKRTGRVRVEVVITPRIDPSMTGAQQSKP